MPARLFPPSVMVSVSNHLCRPRLDSRSVVYGTNRIL